MGRDEQIEEREVLDSIFPDEITDISETSYRIAITLDIPTQDDDEVSDPPILLLTVTYPPTYPDTPPALTLSAPPNTRPHPFFDLRTSSAPLLTSLSPTVDENLGMAMIFTLVTTLKERAEAIAQAAQAAVQLERDRVKAEAEEVENAKFHGERVTRDSFLRWRVGFRREVEEEEERRREEREREGEGRRKVGGKEEKLSGRELWERGLVGKVDEGEEGEGEDGLERLKIGG